MDSTNKKFSFFKSFMKKSVSFFSSGKELSSRKGVKIAGKVLIVYIYILVLYISIIYIYV